LDPPSETPPRSAPAPALSLTHRASWLLGARLAAFAFGMVLPLLLVRRLDQRDFGIYKLVFLVVNTAVTLLPFGFSMSAYYFLPRERDRQGATVLHIVLFLSILGVAGGLAVLLFPQLLVFVARDAAVRAFAPWVGVLIALWIVAAFLEVAPIANQDARLGSLLILAVQLTRTLLLLGAAVIFGTIESLLVAAVVQAALQVVVLLTYLEWRFPGFGRCLDGPMFRRQLAYAMPLGLAGMLYTFQTDLHNYFVSHRFGAAAFAIYSVGCFQLPLTGMLTEAAALVLLPRMNELESAGRTREIVAVTLRAARKLSAVIFPLYAFLMVTGGEFLSFLFTSQYLASLPIFRINLTLLPLSVLLLDPIVRAFAQFRYHLLGFHVVLSLLLVGNLTWATPLYGMVGAISVVVGIRILERLVVTLALARILCFERDDAAPLADIAKLALSAAAAAGAAYGTRQWLLDSRPIVILLGCGLVFALVYLVAVLLFRVPRPDEFALVRRLLQHPWRTASAR
jgi:O-antigen/teichoic acid export membrane protein